MPQFVSGGAAAQNAIARFLMEREEAERQRLMDEFTRNRGQAADDRAQQELMLEAERQRREAEDADRERAKAESDAANTQGWRDMMADAMTQGPMTPESARTIGIMAVREGREAPDEVNRTLNPPRRVMRTTGPNGPVQRAVTEQELIEGVPEVVEPEPEEHGRWQSAGQGVIFNPATGEFRQAPDRPTAPGGGGSAPDAANQYALDTAENVIGAIDELIPPNAPDSRINSLTAGVGGALLGRFGYQPSRDVARDLEAVSGNIAFNALQQMRNASKTGGALGSVAQQELRLLQAVEGSIAQDKSPENLRKQLLKIRDSMERFRAAQAAQGTGGGGTNGGTTRVRWTRDAQGRPVRAQ